MPETKNTDPVGPVDARFYVTKVELTPGSEGGKVTLAPAYRGARNAGWAAATPSGSIEMWINNPAAFAQFTKAVNHVGGPEFDIHFLHAPQAHPGDGHPFEETPKGHYNHPRCAECSGTEEEHARPDGDTV